MMTSGMESLINVKLPVHCYNNTGNYNVHSIKPWWWPIFSVFLCFRLSVIKGSVALLTEFQTLYQELPSYREIFSPILDMMDKLPVNKYPQTLQVLSGFLYWIIQNMTNSFTGTCRFTWTCLLLFMLYHSLWPEHKKKFRFYTVNS